MNLFFCYISDDWFMNIVFYSIWSCDLASVLPCLLLLCDAWLVFYIYIYCLWGWMQFLWLLHYLLFALFCFVMFCVFCACLSSLKIINSHRNTLIWANMFFIRLNKTFYASLGSLPYSFLNIEPLTGSNYKKCEGESEA